MTLQSERKFEDRLQVVKDLLARNEDVALNEYIQQLHPADVAEILLKLDYEDQEKFFSILSWEQASRVLEEVDSETFTSLIGILKKEQKTLILDQMSQDDMVDLLADLSEEKRKEIISLLDLENAQEVRELLVYQEDTAGGIMTKDFIAVRKDITVYQAIEDLRESAGDAETVYYVYVVDNEERLVGVLSLRELIVSKPNKLIEDIMHEQVISVNLDTDQEEVARLVAKYDLLAIPVVDKDNKLMGIITVDDIIDVIEEEATEDIYKFAGTSEIEYTDEDKLSSRIYASVKSRLPWLIITMFGGLLSAKVIGSYEAALNKNTSIALFMPLLAGMGGNVGTQSSTLTVRGIAMGNIKGKEVLKTLLQEFSVGFLVGLVCSIIAALLSLVVQGDIALSIVVGIAMWANMITAASIGTLVPLVFKRIGVDPAVASAPFISTTIDITGLSIYFTLTTILLNKFIL
ncbi:magnesium transporter [Caminicella sporogenes DSM 14501]|uniref:Magnesium transporter MgtE n=1 Tax=Caminicella sporogenes DSM 14501 TaxID=1121266 RepID=A0A1M6MBA5_9FIRM|nr:magnesium transporter [Caminicella sporogenes]RKD27622.1 magnesium transporter [Caminicella sporogenes]WIF94791.1 magnesium transporter [Caminicella sporogenes]SHJ80704.1 magnesium transporter [Caminicella sporogenes DSM 14501]